jgi:hypothetical protein
MPTADSWSGYAFTNVIEVARVGAKQNQRRKCRGRLLIQEYANVQADFAVINCLLNRAVGSELPRWVLLGSDVPSLADFTRGTSSR